MPILREDGREGERCEAATISYNSEGGEARKVRRLDENLSEKQNRPIVFPLLLCCMTMGCRGFSVSKDCMGMQVWTPSFP